MFFTALPKAVRDAVMSRWGAPESDPFYRPGQTDCGSFAIPAFRCGTIAVGLQPARGYNIDPQSSYHDPALVPPHGYLAFYCWLRDAYRAEAIVHLGKHGNLEWLPGKSLALSEECFPEVALGPLPHLYPFIVNDPGEGTQAKRRAAGVIIDHLTPPLTRAESYGPLRDLEQLVDEYYEAAGVDPRRCRVLSEQILDLARSHGVAADCGIAAGDDETSALNKLDGYLCELKELQIRDGLHIFGRSPTGDQLTDLLVALARVPRAGLLDGAETSLLRALARDLALDFDPLDCDMARAVDRREARRARNRGALAHPRRYGRAARAAGAQAGGRRNPGAGRVDAHPRRARPSRRPSSPGGRRLRCGRDRRPAARACGPFRATRPIRRADPRAARRAAHRPQFLFGRHPHRADAGRLAARLEIGHAADRAPRPGAWRLSAQRRAVGLGHVQHAHRRRRHRARPGADGRAADLGCGVAPGHRIRNSAGFRAGPAARRRHVARLGFLPRRLPGPHRPVRFGGARRRRARRAGARQSAGRARARRDRESDGARGERRRGRRARRPTACSAQNPAPMARGCRR